MRKPTPSNPRQPDLFDWLQKNTLTPDQRDAVEAALSISSEARTWRGQNIIPPGSILDKVVALFERTTDFPLEVPAFLTLHAIAAYLLDKGVRIKVAGTELRPDLWTVILAASGAGKTLTTGVITDVMPVRMMPETTSAARFIEELAANNYGAWFQDEWTQVIKRMESQSYAEELRDYLLRLYDNRPISRRTAKASIEVADPALVVVGTTVPESFLQNVSLESMLDGFMQRFQYVVGKPDPSRTPDLFPIYRTREPANITPIQIEWNALSDMPLHDTYVVDEQGEAAFSDAFRSLFNRHRAMPSSFFRRVMWRSFKYALVYHVLLAKPSNVIDAEDLGWAARASALHLVDARRILDHYHMSELEAVIRKAEALQNKLGRQPKPCELVSNIRAIKTAAMAHAVIGLMEELPEGETAKAA